MSQNSALRAFRCLASSWRSSHGQFWPARCISQTTSPAAESPPVPPQQVHNSPPKSQVKSLSDFMLEVSPPFQRATPNDFSNLIPGQTGLMRNLVRDWEEDDRHKVHIYTHKHNTHLTLSKPNRDALISVSCGNIGFKKAGRGSYDAAYQLAAFFMSRIQDKGLLPQIKKIELVYRGFGPGREAVTKAILGTEGRKIRPLIVKLSDSTRLKFGGVRGRKPRRLG